MTIDAPVCPLCGSRRLEVLEENEPPYRVYACLDCTHGFVTPVPDTVTLQAAYAEAYYEPWREQHVAARQRMWRRRLRIVGAAGDGKRLLEVGAGDGAFAVLAAEAGYTVEATEFSEAGADAIRQRAPQVEVHLGELDALTLPEAGFDVIVAWHSVEHMREPFAQLAEMRRLLKPGGRLFMAVPNRENRLMALLYHLFKGRPYPLFSLRTKEIHLHHFTPKSLRLALAKCGFEVEEIGWDNSMVEPAKVVIDYCSALPWLAGGPLATEAMLAKAVVRNE